MGIFQFNWNFSVYFSNRGNKIHFLLSQINIPIRIGNMAKKMKREFPKPIPIKNNKIPYKGLTTNANKYLCVLLSIDLNTIKLYEITQIANNKATILITSSEGLLLTHLFPILQLSFPFV